MSGLIMVIDDSAEILLLYYALLSQEGYQIRLHHPSVRQSEFELVKQVKPDLLIVDLLHPQCLIGWSLIQKIRTDPQTADLPIILCTGEVSLVRQLAPQLGGKRVQVLYKPFDIDELLSIVKQLVAPN